jgi:glycosyltransferase involved in cell wall biosynthesis
MNSNFHNLESIGVSIAVCTFNGSKRIKRTIEHLAKQEIAGVSCELLLIDNCSTDNTAQMVESLWLRFGKPFPLRIIPETQPGTMFARFRAITASNFRYLLYCDDDNWLHSTYVKKALELILDKEEIAAVGGRGVITFREGFEPPAWISQYAKNYGTGEQGRQDGDTTNVKGCLYTAGAILDRKWLKRLYEMGFTSSLTGRKAGFLVAGEDTELTLALRLIGGKLHYSSELYFHHFMPDQRINWKYLRQLQKSHGYSDFLLSPYKLHFKNQSKSFLSNLWSYSYSLAKATIRSIFRGFSEGDIYVARMYRMYGGLNALLKQYKVYLRNKEMVVFLNAQYLKKK